MKGVMCGVVAACALAFAPAALAVVTLIPLGGGSASALWQPQAGLPDTVGVSNFGLVLTQETDGAATAVFNGVAGAPAQSLTELSWERRLDGDCTKTAPRWTLVVAGVKGVNQYLVRFGCAQAGHGPGSAVGWVRDINSRTLIRTRLLQAGGKDALAGTIVSLAIVFDQRGSKGFTVLDNIRIGSSALGTNLWTSPADNAAVLPGVPTFVLDDPSVDPFSASELLTLEEIWPTLTLDDQTIASSAAWVTAE